MLWALDQLARAGRHEPRHDRARLALDVLESYRRRPEFGGPLPSLWVGEGGIALVAWLLAPSPELAARLAELAVAAPEADTLELLWGSPGLLAAADAMLERTGEPRWRDAWSAIAQDLIGRWGERVPHFWTQRLYGREEEIVGAGHGLAGVLSVLARRPELLPHDRLLPEAVAALSATAVREDGLANWTPSLTEGLVHRTGTIRTQWCHGAPGVVTSLAGLPEGTELDGLLLEGGELTSMHAAAQVEADRSRSGRGRHTLWTGDLGTAMYLRQCLDGGSELPAIELW